MTLHAGNGAQGSTFTLALVGVAVRAAKAIAQAIRNRAEVRALNDLDDRALKDIGLMRSDVTAALDWPLHRDPSQHLVDVTGHGRSGRTQAEAATPIVPMRLRSADADVTRAIPANAACA
jgi:uncharacterized protein YjiS (DUF1127 family)